MAIQRRIRVRRGGVMGKPKSPREIMMRAISGPTRFRAALEGYGVIVLEIERELAANGWQIVRKKPELVCKETTQ